MPRCASRFTLVGYIPATFFGASEFSHFVCVPLLRSRMLSWQFPNESNGDLTPTDSGHCVKPNRKDAASVPKILVDRIRGNDDRLFVGCIECHLGLLAAPLKFTAKCAACNLDLIEEIAVS